MCTTATRSGSNTVLKSSYASESKARAVVADLRRRDSDLWGPTATGEMWDEHTYAATDNDEYHLFDPADRAHDPYDGSGVPALNSDAGERRVWWVASTPHHVFVPPTREVAFKAHRRSAPATRGVKLCVNLWG